MILQDKVFTSDGQQSVRSTWLTPQFLGSGDSR